MKLRILQRNGRLLVVTLTLLLLFVANCDGRPTSTVPTPDQPPTITPTSSVQRIIGIQAGHGNGDNGASLCSGANKVPGIDNEADLNLAIANKVVGLLRNVNGYNVQLYVGKDSKMKGLKADAFVAIHADQGKPGVSGYKVSRFGGQKGSGLDGSGDAADRLVQAIWDEYGITTGLSKDTSPGHFTEDMLYYYGLGWIDTDTPGAIIEMGWLCDDLRVLLYEQENVALGIARGIVEFLEDSTAQLPPVSSPQPTPTSVTVTGRIVFASDSGFSTIYSMNPDGSDLSQLVSGTHPAWSPDGNQIAFQQNGQIYVINVDGSGMRQVTYEPYKAEEPDFSPDGSKIAYCGYRANGSPDIYVTDMNSYNPIRLTPGDSWNCSPDWSPDGTQIVFDRWINNSGIIEIFVMKADGQDMKRLTTLTRQGTVHPTWSPDGQQIAFVVAGNLVIMNTNGSNLRYLNIGLQPWSPTWSPSGQHIVFNAESPTRNQEIFIVQVDGSSSPVQISDIPSANNWWADWSR